MPSGDLTRHFGASRVCILDERSGSAWPEFSRGRFRGVADLLDPLPLMKRVDLIAEALEAALPDDVRPLIEQFPQPLLVRTREWRDHHSQHIRRLASEGSRPYLPWKGRLRIDLETQAAFRDVIASLADDDSAYVRRSVHNHLRDRRRLTAGGAGGGWVTRRARRSRR